MKTSKGSCLAILALFAAPGAAHAGTATATGTANFNVVNQCSVTGTTVDLGTYTTTDTAEKIGQQLGYWDDDTLFEFFTGSVGQGTMNLGSVTCDDGTPYSLRIQGNGPLALVGIPLEPGTLPMYTFVKTIGDITIPDETYTPGWGSLTDSVSDPITGIGSGSAQAIRGNIVASLFLHDFNPGALKRNQQLGAPGVYSDTITYTLTF